ncbi:hypothetical protein [Streptomyces bambusae]|uniref:Secreted protein n=1 Tax=Streptomyces bambusae TaxID=1550616 RepID=A0ABS6Z3X8_9ACTN|nr:hypothetical protein [Streptomyces bambusae]MBW5481953.1 hypothetical protein [Streptomyces bambusae]
MRMRLLGFAAAVMTAVLATLGSVAQAAAPGVDGQTCVAGKGTVEYDAIDGQWVCEGGTYHGEPID